MATELSRWLIAESTAGFPLLHVDLAELRDVIRQHGIGAELRRSLVCPCLRRESRQPQIDCPSCYGLGRLYPSSMRESVEVLLTARNPRREDMPAGVVFPGDAQCTFDLGTLPGRGDMLLPDGDVHVVDQVLYPAGVITGTAAVSARATAAGLGDVTPVAPSAPSLRLLYPGLNALGEPDLCIEALGWWDGTETRLGEEGVDFEVFGGNQILWLGGTVPTAISVRYVAPSAYIVEYDPAKFRTEAGLGYPFKCTVHRLDKWAQRDLR